MVRVSGVRYVLVGYGQDGAVKCRILSNRKQLAVARSLFDLGGSDGDIGRWELTPDMWPELSQTFEWPEREKDLRFFLESESVAEGAELDPVG